MPGTYPTLSFASAFKYPVQRKLTKPATIATFCDFSEQRWNKSVPGNLYEFEFHYSKITTADKETLRSFYAQQNGEYATDWSLVFDGNLYRSCQFIGPFVPKNVGPQTWDVTLRCRSLPTVNGGAPEPLPNGLPISATLFILTSHILGSPSGSIGAICSVDGLSLFSRGWLNGGGTWTMRTDSHVVDADSVFTLQVDFAINTASGIFTDTSPEQFLIYDCWLNVSYADGASGVMRPTTAAINYTWTDGAISNPQNAIDGNQTDFATVSRIHFNTIDFSPVLVLSNFA